MSAMMPTPAASASTSAIAPRAAPWAPIAASSARCGMLEGEDVVVIDNQFLDSKRPEGLFLHLDMIVVGEPVKVMSTAKVFRPSIAFSDRFAAEIWQDKPRPIGAQLSADLFSFQRPAASDIDGHDILEVALGPVMPTLVTSKNPALDAARHTTQVEFDRTYRSILRANCYNAKNLLFISGVNIDISPREAFPFPLIKFVRWAAYASLRDGRSFLLEQHDLSEALRAQPAENPDRLSFDESIQRMAGAEEIRLPID